jgi:hypothetical protein
MLNDIGMVQGNAQHSAIVKVIIVGADANTRLNGL